jgi:hypothetical protein
VLCWFDTEDTLVPETDDAALRVAQVFSERGLRATFKLVGEKVRLLEQRGRTDVIDALRSHDVGYHTNLHGVHPNAAEYLSEMGWDEGVREFVRREEAGMNDITRVFSLTPVCYGQPGGAWAPQAYGAMRLWGIPAYVSNTSFASMDDRPFYYCGVFTVSRMGQNQLSMGFDIDNGEAFDKLKRAFAERHAALRKEGGGVISISSHPLQWVLDGEFCDTLNFSGGRNVPRSAWRQPPLKSPQRIEAGFRNLATFLDFARKFEGVRFVGIKELTEDFPDKAVDAELDLTELLLVATTITDDVGFQQITPGYISAAELFYLVGTGIAEYAKSKKIPQILRCRPILGPIRSTQTTVREGGVSLDEFLNASVSALDYMHHYGRMPSELYAGAGLIAPEDFLVTALSLLPDLVIKKEPLQVEIRKGRLQSANLVNDEFAQSAWRWHMFGKEFKAPRLLELAKLQAWSIKPA